MLGLQLLYPPDEVSLLKTAITLLIPLGQNLLQILHFQLLKVNCTEVNLLFVCQLTDLSVCFLQLLANFITGHSPGQWLAELLECSFNFGLIGLIFFWKSCTEPVKYRYADFTVSCLEAEHHRKDG